MGVKVVAKGRQLGSREESTAQTRPRRRPAAAFSRHFSSPTAAEDQAWALAFDARGGTIGVDVERPSVPYTTSREITTSSTLQTRPDRTWSQRLRSRIERRPPRGLALDSVRGDSGRSASSAMSFDVLHIDSR